MTRLYKLPVLGYIPAGTTNDFASSLQISSNTMKAAQTVIDGHPQPVDIGFFCEERTFVYVAAFGAFTEVSYMTPQEKKNLLGHQAYMLEGVKSLTNLKSYTMTVESDEDVYKRQVFVLSLFGGSMPTPALVAVSILASALAGLVYSLLLGFSAITLKADQTIGGTALNMMATAFAIVVVKAFNNANANGSGASSAKLRCV